MDEGNEVTVFLVQNAVLPTRQSKYSKLLEDLSSYGEKLLADDFALQMRGINKDNMINCVGFGKLETVIDSLASGHKVIWN